MQIMELMGIEPMSI